MNKTVDTVRELAHWIDGAPRAHASEAWIESVNPSDGAVCARVPVADRAVVDAAVESAYAAYRAWRSVDPFERSRVLTHLAAEIRSNADRLVAIEREETGKPLSEAATEIETAAGYFEFFAGLVHAPVGDVIDAGPLQRSFTRREPYGVIGVITPWNGPMSQAARAIAPALAVGNAVVIKPSEATSSATVELARIASDSGLPRGLINVVLGDGATTGVALVESELVRKISFTGSVRAGREVARRAAERVVPLTLELGGKSANIIFEDADLSVAVPGSLRAFTWNAGQVCSAGSRLLVHRNVYRQVVDELAKLSTDVRPGDSLGPMITRGQYEKVLEAFETAADEQVTAVVGGTPLESDGGGFFVPVTIYCDVDPDSRLLREEIFGPVVVVVPFDDDDEAVRLANDSEYGLAAGLWTTDLTRALRVSDQLEAGQVYVNQWAAGIWAPFGGYKLSGYGREKGFEALREYTHLKTVAISVPEHIA